MTDEEKIEHVRELRRESAHFNQAQRTKYMREWRKKNPDKVKAAAKRYRESHKDKIREYTREWQRKNPDKVKINTIRYLMRKAEREKQ